MDERRPTKSEDEYFVKQDAELIKQQRARLDAERAKAERASHFMRCPKCGGRLREEDFHHVKVDRCEECGGVWLDKGEIDLMMRIDQSNIRAFVRGLFGAKT